MIPNRFARIKSYIDVLEKNIKIKIKHDVERLKGLKEAFDKKYLAARTFLTLKVVFFVLLYASVLAAFFATIPFLTNLSTYLIMVSGVFGTTISFLVLAVLHFSEGTVYSDLILLSNHMMIIYVHNDHLSHPDIEAYIRQMVEKH